MTAKQSAHEWRLGQIDGQSVAVCSCGEQSGLLPSPSAAADWHAAHVKPPTTKVKD